MRLREGRRLKILRLEFDPLLQRRLRHLHVIGAVSVSAPAGRIHIATHFTDVVEQAGLWEEMAEGLPAVGRFMAVPSL